MVCRRSDFEGQPVGEAQNPLGQTFTPQTEGNRVQGGGRRTRRVRLAILMKMTGLFQGGASQLLHPIDGRRRPGRMRLPA